MLPRGRQRLVATFGCVVLLVFCLEVWQEYAWSAGRDTTSTGSSSSSSSGGPWPPGGTAALHDETRARAGTTYPVCGQLDALERDLQREERQRPDAEQRYEAMLRAGQMNCGHVRVGLGIISRRHNVPWVDCVREIIPAKRRLLGFVKHQCRVQQEANDRVAAASSGSGSSGSGSSTGSGSTSRGSSPSAGNVTHPAASRSSDVVGAPRRRGVIFTGKDEHFRDIYQSIYALRLVGVRLPVEIWVNTRDMDICQAVFTAVPFPTTPIPPGAAAATATAAASTASVPGSAPGSAPVECKQLPNFVHGFTSKFYALASTALTDVFFMDADNIAVRDINAVFDSEGYRRTGAVVWPDLWGDRCLSKGSGAPKHPGDSAYRTHVLWVARFAGLGWENVREKAQEAEAGQLAFDLTRHRGLLDFGRRFIEDQVFLKKPINGDKDIFRFAHLIFGEPFYFVPHIPGYSFNGHLRDCIVHFFGGDRDAAPVPSPDTATTAASAAAEKPMFFHQLKTREPAAFTQLLRVPMQERSAPSACAPIGVVPPPGYAPPRAPAAGTVTNSSHATLRPRRRLVASTTTPAAAAPATAESSTPIPPLVAEHAPPGTAHLPAFAARLFAGVDAGWRDARADALLWWHRFRLTTTLCSVKIWFMRCTRY